MTDSHYGVTPGGAWPPPGPPAGPLSSWSPPVPKQSRAPVIISLVVALIAIAVAIGAWFKPSDRDAATPPSDPTPQYSDQQIADAKKAVCGAHDLVYRATTYSGTQKSDDPALQLIIAVNIRLTSSLSAQYFQTKLDQYPATPPDLAAAMRELVATNQEMALLQIANASKDELEPIYQSFDAADARVIQACK
jgi:hypothetical protein